MNTGPAAPLSPEPPDFSLILGGPLFQLLRRAHLSGDVADLVWRRVIALALITWLPLLALSIAEGHAWGDSVKVPFLFDVDVHARFLLALPLLIVAELVVHQRMRVVVGTFVKRGLVPDEARGSGYPYLVWDDSDWETSTDAGRLVAWLRESAARPVHSTALVFPAANL